LIKPPPSDPAQPTDRAVAGILQDRAGYDYNKLLTISREWAMLRWHLKDESLIAESVKRSLEQGESLSPRELVDRLATRFGLEDPHQGGNRKDLAVRDTVIARGQAIDQQWAQARSTVGTEPAPGRPASAAERARAQLMKRS